MMSSPAKPPTATRSWRTQNVLICTRPKPGVLLSVLAPLKSSTCSKMAGTPSIQKENPLQALDVLYPMSSQHQICDIQAVQHQHADCLQSSERKEGVCSIRFTCLPDSCPFAVSLTLYLGGTAGHCTVVVYAVLICGVHVVLGGYP